MAEAETNHTPEPVAWRYRTLTSDGPGEWQLSMPEISLDKNLFEVEPLFALPPLLPMAEAKTKGGPDSAFGPLRRAAEDMLRTHPPSPATRANWRKQAIPRVVLALLAKAEEAS